MATGEDCDAALVSELLSNDVDSVVKDLVLWEQDVTRTPSEFPNDLPELFGDNADVVLEELKFLHTQSVDSIFEDSDSPPHKQAKMLANPTSSKVQRFPPPMLSPERAAAARGVVPCNTSSNTQWALNNFNSCAKECSKLGPSHAVPTNLLESHDAELVCKWLCLFMLETQREDKKPYHLPTIRNLVSGLNRVLQSG